jgi:DNA invertase Pin-like site-specific DNA recombinase
MENSRVGSATEAAGAPRNGAFAIYVRSACFEPQPPANICRQHEQVTAALRFLTSSIPSFTAVLYQESGESGVSTTPPPQMARMLADAEAGRFGTLIIAHVDRLSRRISRIVELGQQLERAGVEVFVAGPGKMLGDLLDLLAGFAAFADQR